MLSNLVPLVLASIAIVRAQTPDVDQANIENVKLVGADGEVIQDAAYKAAVGVQFDFTDGGFDIAALPGMLLTTTQTKGQPSIKLYSTTDISTKGYLISMVDPDAPTPQNKSEAQVNHWLSENNVAGTGANNLYTLTLNANPVWKYRGPGPGAGSAPHRYTITVWEQPTPSITAPSGDDNIVFRQFDIAAYAAKIDGLKLVGATYMQVGPDPTTPNNGTYTPPVGGSTGTASGSQSSGPSGTKSSSTPSSTDAGSSTPTGAASSIRAGASSLVLGAAAFFMWAA